MSWEQLPMFSPSCPCGSDGHTLETHPTRVRYGFTPKLGDYPMDDPVAEHRDGEHELHPDPESCPACAS
jgi:hypothetical protein